MNSKQDTGVERQPVSSLTFWIICRCAFPLILAGAVILLRRHESYMETFVATVWIGFAIHMFGLTFLNTRRWLDVFSFFPLLYFYGAVASFGESNYSVEHLLIIPASFFLSVSISYYARHLYLSSRNANGESTG